MIDTELSQIAECLKSSRNDSIANKCTITKGISNE